MLTRHLKKSCKLSNPNKISQRTCNGTDTSKPLFDTSTASCRSEGWDRRQLQSQFLFAFLWTSFSSRCRWFWWGLFRLWFRSLRGSWLLLLFFSLLCHDSVSGKIYSLFLWFVRSVGSRLPRRRICRESNSMKELKREKALDCNQLKKIHGKWVEWRRKNVTCMARSVSSESVRNNYNYLTFYFLPSVSYFSPRSLFVIYLETDTFRNRMTNECLWQKLKRFWGDS